MDFINSYNDALILIDAATSLDVCWHYSPVYPGALHSFVISIDGREVADIANAGAVNDARREAFFAFLCSILNRWYSGCPADEVPSLKIRVAVLCNELRRILNDAPRDGVVVYWHNGEYVVNPDDDRDLDLTLAHAPCLRLDANALEVETQKGE